MELCSEAAAISTTRLSFVAVWSKTTGLGANWVTFVSARAPGTGAAKPLTAHTANRHNRLVVVFVVVIAKNVASAILADAEPWLPARRDRVVRGKIALKLEHFARRAVFRGGKKPPSMAGREACRHITRQVLKAEYVVLVRLPPEVWFTSSLTPPSYWTPPCNSAPPNNHHWARRWL